MLDSGDDEVDGAKTISVELVDGASVTVITSEVILIEVDVEFSSIVEDGEGGFEAVGIVSGVGGPVSNAGSVIA